MLQTLAVQMIVKRYNRMEAKGQDKDNGNNAKEEKGKLKRKSIKKKNIIGPESFKESKKAETKRNPLLMIAMPNQFHSIKI